MALSHMTISTLPRKSCFDFPKSRANTANKDVWNNNSSLAVRFFGLIAIVLLPKGPFGSLNKSTELIVLQPYGTNGRESYHPIEVSTLSILPFLLTS